MWASVLMLVVGVVGSDQWGRLKHLQTGLKAMPAPVSIVGTAPLVQVLCGERTFLVIVGLDLFGTGHLIWASELTLGPSGCPFTQLDTWANTVLFHRGLSECGSAVMVTEHHFLYSTHLYYTPKQPGLAIVRTAMTIAHIECSYLRKDNVNSQAVGPTWASFSSLATRGRFLSYSLLQMNDNWDAERASNRYYLGDFIHIEASVVGSSHVLLRVYVDTCVATLTPDKVSTPRYPLVDFHGCLVDSRGGDSRSSLVSPRTQPDKLRIKLGAFRFPNARSLIYITCRLKAAEADAVPNPVNKACFFQKPANVWTSVEGPNGICLCCNHGNCGGRNILPQQITAVSQIPDDQLRKEGEIQMGPLEILAADPGDLSPRVQTEGWNESSGRGPPEYDGVDLKTMLILMGVVGAAALLLSGLLVGGAVMCGAFTIFSLYNKLA